MPSELNDPANAKYRKQFSLNCARVGQTEIEYIREKRIEEGLDEAPQTRKVKPKPSEKPRGKEESGQG